jgi:oxygen-dependent protoporphyrinogen oxidase
MIGRLDSSTRQVTIVGAGVAGLLAAHRLDRAGWEVTLIESSDRAGGMIRTERLEPGISEAAAHSLLATRAVRALCEDLGVALEAVGPDSRARYIVRGGRLRRFPLTGWETIRTFLRAYFVLSRGDLTITLDAWCRRHLGRAALDFGLDPFVSGIYASSPAELRLDAAFPALAIPRGHSLLSYWLARHVTRRSQFARAPGDPERRMMAPTHGMQSLTDALASRLRERLGERFRLGVRVDQLPHAPNLILSVPAAECARLVEPEDAQLGSALKAIRHAPLVSMTVFAREASFAKLPRGVGFLVPGREQREILGILFNSSAFPSRSRSGMMSFTVMAGGTRRTDILTRPDAELKEIAIAEMRSLLGLKDAIDECRIHRWERAIPVYGPELVRAWELARQGWCSRPGRVIFANHSGQVSLRGMIESSLLLPQV